MNINRHIRSFMQFIPMLLFIGMCVACARMGQPDGGWYDEVPPRVVGASPAERSTGVTQKRITINFNEFIKLENATENVVICPPQIEQPEINVKGKSVRIDLKDSLKANTTYTIDFSDAISDFTEGNPMGNFTYVFSTGDAIDTLSVSGYVLDSESLEPVKGQLVGLYANLADSAFTTQPMLRTGRTDASGHFSIRGIAPGDYRIYSLEDGDANFMLSQRGERLAFSHDIITPTAKPDIRMDTTWVDSLHISGIERVPFIHYYPDDICLMSFQQKLTDRYLVKSERKEPNRMTFYFSAPNDTLPQIKGLNFEHDNAFVIETSEHLDTITYWLRDTMLVNQDTLHIEYRYMMTDTLGNLVEQADTLEMLAKIPYEKRLKTRLEERAKLEKKNEKDKKKGKNVEPLPRENILEVKFAGSQEMTPTQNVHITLPTPIEHIDTAGIHLYSKIDSAWYRSPFELISEGLPPRTYAVRGEWRPGIEYSLEIDSAAITDIYGNLNNAVKRGIKIGENDKYSSLFVNITGVKDNSGQYIVRMHSESGDIKYMAPVDNGTAEFYYVTPGTYYLSAHHDRNGNGKWDTGDYALDLQAEDIYYYDESVVCKEKWDITANFDINRLPRYEQKPRKLVKQKGEQKKKINERNAKRAQDLGIKYDRDKVNARF